MKLIDGEAGRTLEALIDCAHNNWWTNIGHAAFLHLYSSVQMLKKEGYDAQNYDKLFLYYSRSDKKKFDEVYSAMKLL